MAISKGIHLVQSLLLVSNFIILACDMMLFRTKVWWFLNKIQRFTWFIL